MKRIIFTRDVPTAHPEAGRLVPGLNEIADDALAERLLEAGRLTGDYVAPRQGQHTGEVAPTQGRHTGEVAPTQGRHTGEVAPERDRADVSTDGEGPRLAPTRRRRQEKE